MTRDQAKLELAKRGIRPGQRVRLVTGATISYEAALQELGAPPPAADLSQGVFQQRRGDRA